MGVVQSFIVSNPFKEQNTDDCRLNKLNWDCLEKIFDHLATEDYLHLTQINPMIRDAVLERAIQRQSINFNQDTRQSIKNVFKTFGKHMKNVKADEKHFGQWTKTGTAPINRFLELLIKYGTMDRITHLYLTFDCRKVEAKLLNAAIPYFTNLHTLEITGSNSEIENNDLAATIINVAENLSVIVLKNTDIDSNSLSFESLKNIKIIILIKSKLLNANDLSTLFSNQSKLKSFVCCQGSPNYPVCKYIAHYRTDLELFLDVPNIFPNECSKVWTMNRYDYFSKFTNLKKVAITSLMSSGEDVIDVLLKISQRNTVENLCIYFSNRTGNKGGSIDFSLQNEYAKFTSLTMLTIAGFEQNNFWCSHIVKFVEKAENLHTIIIAGVSISPATIVCLTFAARRLKLLNLAAHSFGKRDNNDNIPLCVTLDNIGAMLNSKFQNGEEQNLCVHLNLGQKKQLAQNKFVVNERIKIVEVSQPVTIFKTHYKNFILLLPEKNP